jgi:hypothetical protein
MIVPMAVVMGSGNTIIATPAAIIPLLSGLLVFLNSFLTLILCFIYHPHLQAHPVIDLVSLPG